MAPPIAPAAGVPAPPAPPRSFDLGTPTPIASQPEQGRSSKRWLLAILVAALLIGAGFLVGNLIGDDTQTSVEAPIVDLQDDNDAALPVEEEPVAEQPQQSVEPEAAEAPEEPSTQPPARPEPLAVPESAPLGEGAEPVADVARAVGPAVVLIETDFGQGSGIIYDETGLLVTNAHVVEDATTVRVRLASGYLVQGEVLGADAERDVAVVRIPADQEFGVAVLAPQSTVEVGQLAVAIGSPFGLEQTVTAGIVSATGRTFVGAQNPVEMIQTDAPINPGNSGGALADRQGRVVGMNTAIRTNGSSDNAGVGFAIPSDTFKLIADRLVNGETLEAGFLGVGLAAIEFGQPGALVGSVNPGTAAELGGIEIGDLITKFNGEDILSGSDLAAAVQLSVPNSPAQVELLRNGELIIVEVVLGSR